MGKYRKNQELKWCVKTSGNRLYYIWHSMKTRCNNKNFPYYYNYGGRGISVCASWNNSFDEFYKWANANGYEYHLTLERIDGDKGYCPENCKWATIKEQARNRKNNRVLEINGERLVVVDWAKRAGISASAVYKRLDSGYSHVEAVYGKS